MGQLYNQMKMALELKNFSPRTISCYLDCMVHFVRHYGRSPAEMGEEEIRNYLYYLMKEKKVSQSSMNQAYSAMKFFYETTLPAAGRHGKKVERDQDSPDQEPKETSRSPGQGRDPIPSSMHAQSQAPGHIDDHLLRRAQN